MKNFMKTLAFIASTCLLFASSLVCIPAVATGSEVVKRRVLIMSAPYDAGPISRNNSFAMRAAFTSNNTTILGNDYKYEVHSYVNNQAGHSTVTFLNVITNILGDSDDNDISYVYINAHGATNGELAINGAASDDKLSLSALRQCLNTIDGKIVLMIDSCHSGNAVASGRNATENNERVEENIDIAHTMLNSFFGTDTRSGEFLGSQKFCVLCSCLPEEGSYVCPIDEDDISGETIMTATYAWARVLGYDYLTGVYISSFPDDSLGDGVINPAELIDATNDYIADYSRPGYIQHAAFYMHNKMTSIFYKNYMTGDVNMDKQITSADTLKLSQYLAGTATLSTTALLLADTNQDGVVNMSDKLEMQSYFAEIATFTA